MSQLERMKAAANRKPKEQQKPPEKNLPVEKKVKQPKPPKPEYLGLANVPCEACGVDHPLPIHHDHWVFLKCKKPWPKKNKSLNSAEKLDKRMAAKRLPDKSMVEATYFASTQEWHGVLIVEDQTFHAVHSGQIGVMIALDRKYREHLIEKFAAVTPKVKE